MTSSYRRFAFCLRSARVQPCISVDAVLVCPVYLQVLGEAFSLDDDEDMVIRDVSHLWILEGRYRVEISHVPAGNWVLIGGVDLSVVKTSTITNVDHGEEVEIFAPLLFNSVPVIKVACEPLQPSELPKMLEVRIPGPSSLCLPHTTVCLSVSFVDPDGQGHLLRKAKCLLSDLYDYVVVQSGSQGKVDCEISLTASILSISRT